MYLACLLKIWFSSRNGFQGGKGSSMACKFLSILAPYHFCNLLLFTETPNLIPNSFVVFTHNICRFPPEILFFKYLPRCSVCLEKFNTLLNFRKCKPGVSYTFNSLYKLISFIYSSSSSNTWTGLDLQITC